MNVTREELERAKEGMVRLSPLAPDGPESLTWPAGKVYPS